MQHVTDCHVDPVTGRASADARRDAETLYLGLAGLGCPNCANRVRNALLAVQGVVDVEIDLPAGLATVWRHPGEAEVPDLIFVVADAARGTHHRYLAVPLPVRD